MHGFGAAQAWFIYEGDSRTAVCTLYVSQFSVHSVKHVADFTKHSMIYLSVSRLGVVEHSCNTAFEMQTWLPLARQSKAKETLVTRLAFYPR